MLTDEQIQKVKEALHHTHLLTKYMYYGSLGIAFIIIGLIDFVIFKYTTNLVLKLLALGLILYGLGFIVYVVKHIKSTNEKLAIILYRLETHTYLYKKINTYSVSGYDEYDSHVILAKDVAQAVRIAKKAPWGDWTFDENCIVVERVLLSDKAGVIHSSFRAG